MLDVIRELAALSAADRAAILDALDPAERARAEAALAGGAGQRRHSAWMEALLAAATDPGDTTMTATTRAALLAAAGRTRPAGEPMSPMRSLLQAAGGALAQVRAR